MVAEETQKARDCLSKAQSKSGITQLDSPGMVASTNVPEILTVSDYEERLLPALREQSSEDQVCGRPMSPGPDEDVSLMIPEISQPFVEEALIREENSRISHDFDAILDQEIPEELAFSFPDQGAQGLGSPSSSSVLCQDITTVAESGPQIEHWTSRTASLVNHSEDVHEGGVQPLNISYSGSTVNASADTSLPNNPMGQNPQIHIPSFSDICDYELEKLNREEGTLRKNFEETTSELKAELERKMAEARSEYDRKFQEVDAAYNAQAKKEEAYRSFVAMNSLLANAFKSKCTDTTAATNTAAVRAARSSQQSTHQQQAVQTNTHMNSTTLPRPSITAAEAPIPNLSGPVLHSPCYNTTQPRSISQQAAVYINSTAQLRSSVTVADAPVPNPSGPLSYSPHCNTTQPSPISQQAAIQSNTHTNSTAAPQPSVTAAEAPTPNLSGPLSQFPRCSTTQPRPISPQTAIQSNTLTNSTASPRLSVTAEALPLHSPRINTPQPRPPPLISNHTPSSYSAASKHGVVRAMAPHLRSSRAPISASASASTTYQTRLVQEQQQQQENSNSGLVYLSDDDV